MYESAEQIITAFVRWHLNHELKGLEIKRNSHIVAAQCRQQVPLTQTSVVGPFEGDPDQALDQCIENLQRLRVRKWGTAKLKRKKGEKK